MTVLIAREGDIVTCADKNHPLFRIKRDICRPAGPLRAADFEPGHPKLGQPVTNEKVPVCPDCGSAFIATGVGVHFEDGWRK